LTITATVKGVKPARPTENIPMPDWPIPDGEPDERRLIKAHGSSIETALETANVADLAEVLVVFAD
jgi:hypothetical protein